LLLLFADKLFEVPMHFTCCIFATSWSTLSGSGANDVRKASNAIS